MKARAARHAVYAAAIILAPIAVFLGTLLNPGVGGIGAGATNIAANAVADPAANELHVVFYAIDAFLLPISVLGLAGILIPRAPWLGTIGGGLALVGWLPWSALTAQDDLTLQMARLGGGPDFVQLWNTFTTDLVMGSLTLIYVVAHLIAYIVLGIGLARTNLVPGWAGWALALTSPLTVVGFAARVHELLYVVTALWLAGSIPAVNVVWRDRG